MNYKSVKGYTLTVGSLLVLTAGMIVVIGNWGTVRLVHVYTKDYEVSIGLLMLLSAAGGIVAALMLMILKKGILALRQGRAARPVPAPPAATTTSSTEPK